MLNLMSAMKSRVSTRTFDGKPLTARELSALEKLLQDIEQAKKPDFLLPVRLTLHAGQGARMGTFGLIASASGFLVPAVRNAPFAMESVGYSLEQVILGATSLGIGSCWIGGVFSRARANEVARAGKDEIVPVIAAIGHPASQRSLADRIVTGAAQSRVRKPLSEIFFSVAAKPHDSADAGVESASAAGLAVSWDTILEMVRIAPSASNKQPWRIVQASGTLQFVFFMEENVRYNNSLGDVHLQNIDMGIAMCHFNAAAEAFNLAGTWRSLAENKDTASRDDDETVSTALAFGKSRGWKPIAVWQQMH